MTIIGIDPHPGQHTAAALDSTGQTLQLRSFPDSQEGLEAFLEWLSAFPQPRLGVEGPTQPFFAPWLARLLGEGIEVFPVPTQEVSLLRRRLARGKSDPQDATHVARALLANQTLSPLSQPQWLRPLQELARTRKALAQELKAHRMRLEAIQDLLVREAVLRVIKALEGEVAALEKEMARRVKEIAPKVLHISGIGPIVAGTILSEVGDIRRFSNEARFAAYCGAAPIPWQSGAGGGVRVNPGGNRTLNWALHLIALTRLRIDPSTQTLLARKVREGKTKREALRVLKTYLARELYHLLKALFTPLPHPGPLIP